MLPSSASNALQTTPRGDGVFHAKVPTLKLGREAIRMVSSRRREEEQDVHTAG